MEDNLTAEEIQSQYNTALDSVMFINELIEGKHDKDLNADEKADALARNSLHLEIILTKDFWLDQDLQPFRDAIDLAKT